MKYTPDRHPWSPLTVAEVISVLDGVPGLWWLSGGCAIDEYLGSPTREHGDIDVTVAREDWPAIHEALRDTLDIWIAGGDHFRSTATEALRPGDHNLWARWPGDGPWRLQLNLEDITGGTWTYRRDPRITRPVAEASWWSGRLTCIAPAVQLLWKSRDPLPKDDLDHPLTSPNTSRRRSAKCVPLCRL